MQSLSFNTKKFELDETKINTLEDLKNVLVALNIKFIGVNPPEKLMPYMKEVE